jgi:hypothetical protein
MLAEFWLGSCDIVIAAEANPDTGPLTVKRELEAGMTKP